MREILFRGKSTIGKRWIYGDLIHDPECKNPQIGYVVNLSGDSISNPPSSQYIKFEVDHETIGQLWIKAGFRLFGGDLVAAICSPSGSKKKKERLCKISDREDGFDVSVWYHKEWWSYCHFNFCSIKLVGNIHDNPELLKP